MVPEFRCLDDKSFCNVLSLRVKFNKDLSFSEMKKNFLKTLWVIFMDEVQLPQYYRATRGDSLLSPLSPQ